jgi:cytochrome c-type biogenesis protein CcmE
MKKIQIIALIFIIAAIGVIIFTTMKDSSEYADFAQTMENEGDEYHVVGRLNKSKPQLYEPLKNANYFEFYMTDEKGLESKVVYNGSKPDGFDQSEKIVIAGKYENNQFEASQILMKCPSKYVDEKAQM